VHPSLAPSMDIQVASNFERFISFAVGRDPAKVREVMDTFKKTGAYTFPNFNRDTFSASRTTDAEIASIIQRVHRDYGYIADPHTACAFKDVAADKSDGVQIVLATASPAKFPETIQRAIGIEPKHPSLEALKAKPIVKHRLKATPDAIRAFIDARAVR
jgi:threonine synthase